jgi:hypothetical protein
VVLVWGRLVNVFVLIAVKPKNIKEACLVINKNAQTVAAQ